MKAVLHKKSWHTGALQIYVEPLLILLIKSDNDAKVGKDCVGLNFVGILHQKNRVYKSSNGLIWQ